jgi:hypothetical protein
MKKLIIALMIFLLGFSTNSQAQTTVTVSCSFSGCNVTLTFDVYGDCESGLYFYYGSIIDQIMDQCKQSQYTARWTAWFMFGCIANAAMDALNCCWYFQQNQIEVRLEGKDMYRPVCCPIDPYHLGCGFQLCDKWSFWRCELENGVYQWKQFGEGFTNYGAPIDCSFPTCTGDPDCE